MCLGITAVVGVYSTSVKFFFQPPINWLLGGKYALQVDCDMAAVFPWF